MAKKYYWLKLQKDFFSQPIIKKLRRIAGGDTYTIIYLKMQLSSLENNGKLYFEGIEDTFAKELSLTLDEDSDNIEVTLSFLQKYGLLEEISPDEFTLPETLENIGTETSGASRVRRFRQRQKALLSNGVVTNGNTEKRREEKEIELEKDKELDKERENTEEINSSLSNKAIELCKYFETLKPGQSISKHMATLNIFIDNYGYYWCKEALQKTITAKDQFIKPYMEKILQNWQAEGKPEVKKGVESNESSEPPKHKKGLDESGIGFHF